ncbi:acyltransferase family protein [Klebsiella michiganensis]|uniref:acyltransferase family protein n=1 Tax=Klebsiella michiganensis TaxID=1134687 RepID=UPI0030F9F0A6
MTCLFAPSLSKGRLLNLLYLYLLWCVIQWISVQYILDIITGQKISQNINAIYSLNFISFVRLIVTGMSSSWYLYALLIYLIVSKIGRNKFLIFFMFSLVIHYIAVLKLIPYWGPQSILRYFIFYYIGANVSPLIMELTLLKFKNIFPWAMLFFGAAIHRISGLNQNIFESLLAIILAIMFSRWINRYSLMRKFNQLGYITLPIYVIHRILVELFGMISIQYAIENKSFNHPFFSIVWASGYPVFITAICCIMSLILWKVSSHGIGLWLYGIRIKTGKTHAA